MVPIDGPAFRNEAIFRPCEPARMVERIFRWRNALVQVLIVGFDGFVVIIVLDGSVLLLFASLLLFVPVFHVSDQKVATHHG